MSQVQVRGFSKSRLSDTFMSLQTSHCRCLQYYDYFYLLSWWSWSKQEKPFIVQDKVIDQYKCLYDFHHSHLLHFVAAKLKSGLSLLSSNRVVVCWSTSANQQHCLIEANERVVCLNTTLNELLFHESRITTSRLFASMHQQRCSFHPRLSGLM